MPTILQTYKLAGPVIQGNGKLEFEDISPAAIRARGDIQQLKALAASSSGIAPVSAYGVAARPI